MNRWRIHQSKCLGAAAINRLVGRFVVILQQFEIAFDRSINKSKKKGMTASDLTNAANLAGVLKLLSANSTELVKKGEKQLKPFLKQPACTEHLLNQIQNNEEIVVRHHAALLLKKKLGAFYPKFNAQLKAALKIHLLNLMLSEPDKGVRTSIAGCVAILAKAVFSTSEQWPELFSSLMQMSQDPSEDRRALNYNLLSQVSVYCT